MIKIATGPESFNQGSINSAHILNHYSSFTFTNSKTANPHEEPRGINNNSRMTRKGVLSVTIHLDPSCELKCSTVAGVDQTTAATPRIV